METDKCPVCGEDIISGEKCIQCGFAEIEQSFINEEEGILWRKKVIKYRETWIESLPNYLSQRLADRLDGKMSSKEENRIVMEYFAYINKMMDIQEKEKRIYSD